MAVSATINVAPTITGGTATVYPQSNWPYGTAISGTPLGSSVTTGSVGTDGSVTFSGLTASTLYVAYQATPDRYVRFRTAAAAATPASSGSLTPTAVKTGAYTAVAGDLVLVDTTSGAVTITLPAAAAGVSVGVKMVTLGGSNAVTIAAAGSDVFNKAGGATTLTLSLLNQGVVLAGSTGVWVVEADDMALSQLDTRYRVARGRAKFGGNVQLSIPGVVATGVNTWTSSSNRAQYFPFLVDTSITVDQIVVEITAAAATSNFRVAIYNADTDWQPTTLVSGADTGALAGTATGVIATTISDTVLAPGRYLFWLSESTGNIIFRSMRASVSQMLGFGTGLGSTPSWSQIYTAAAQTYGAPPSTGLAWDSVGVNVPGLFDNPVLVRVKTP